MKETLFSQWCATATRLIRYRPDRDAVYDELMAHLEDRRNALWEQGMDYDEAYREALQAMGDAEEVAEELAAVHKPFWGYLYRITKIACILLCLLAALGICIQADNWYPYYTATEAHESANLLKPKGTKEWALVQTLSPKTVSFWEGYWLYVPEARLYANPELGQWLSLDLRVLYVPIQGSMTAERSFYAVDDQGNRYDYHYLDWYTDPDGKYLLMDRWSTGVGGNMSVLSITGLPSEGVQWIELRYDRDGRNLALRIDLTGGEAQ